MGLICFCAGFVLGVLAVVVVGVGLGANTPDDDSWS